MEAWIYTRVIINVSGESWRLILHWFCEKIIKQRLSKICLIYTDVSCTSYVIWD